MAKKLILASASPRRREILDTAGYVYEVIPSDSEEISGGIAPEELVRLNALAKAKEVYSRSNPDSVVIGADTVVCLNGEVLGKPNGEKQAFEMLKRLSNSSHEVMTGYAVVTAEGEESGVCSTSVHFRTMTDDEIYAYIATGEPLDKAGAYGIQERACLFAESFEGDYFNIIGLPVAKLCPMLKKHGIIPAWQKLFGKKPQNC